LYRAQVQPNEAKLADKSKAVARSGLPCEIHTY